MENQNKQNRNKSIFKLTRVVTGILIWLLLTPIYVKAQNTWKIKEYVGGYSRVFATGFGIGTKGYIGTGWEDLFSAPVNDFWEFDPDSNKWTQKADFPGGVRYSGVAFNIGSKGYFGTGIAVGYDWYNDFWEYNPATNIWTRRADFPGTKRSWAVGFSIGNKGYIGMGGDKTSSTNDFWEYNPITNVWTKKADLPGPKREGAVGFSIGSKGYVGTGGENSSLDDFWEYDPATNVWTAKGFFPGGMRSEAVGFSIGQKGYLGTGFQHQSTGNIHYGDFWEYDPTTDIWTIKANFPGSGQARQDAVGFSIGNKGYLGTGYFWEGTNEYPSNDFYEYSPTITTGISETEKQIELSIYPNPTTGSFSINSSTLIDAYQIYDVNGKEVDRNTELLHSNLININPGLKDGFYLIQIQTKNGVATRKIIVSTKN